MSEYDVKLTASALRSLETVPARVAEPLLSFIFGGLAAAPRRRGKPLRGQLDGWWAARRGEYRVVYRIDDPTMTMYVLRIAHRGQAYRSW